MAQTNDEVVEMDLTDLDTEPQGGEMRPQDFVLLFSIGLVVPVILLIWGWL